jgi:hypothetical protein
MDTLNGLPAHILLVHAVVVLLPLAAFLLVLIAVWPAARRHLAPANAVLSVVVLALIPVTTSAGEWLEKNVEASTLVREHAERGDTAIFVALPIAVLALVIWWRGREIDALAASRTAGTDVDPAAIDGSSGSASGVAITDRTATRHRLLLAPESALVSIVIAVLAVVAAGAAVYDTYLIGDSGAQATWQGQINSAPPGGEPAGDNN